ncbi:uncharacterized protein LOC114716223 [Neltuma alba]|uniref:uncharacterized protein LOC114716223 n=1 Tax=Neltuma alba TaxID=207710 RepID=UPI0010A4B7AB|nr:uncharacterized protein LOC114716223 [Prosopis alba]
MASSKNCLGRPSYRFFSNPTDIANMHTPSDSAFEFHELDLHSSVVVEPDESRVQGCGMPNKPCSSKLEVGRSSDPSSQPIDIPDWSKILGNQYRQNRGKDEVDDQVQDEGSMVPPHEFLANTRMASMSVQEGIGRTLKGRDLSRVRNSVWAKTGFQD